MRISSFAMALGTASMFGLFLWASGCSNLSDDCELNLNCPAVYIDKPNCSQVIFPGDCDVCLQTNCCPEMAACIAQGSCVDLCMSNVLPVPEQCASLDGQLKDVFTAANQCLETKCADKCVLADTCNPVTHKGCTTQGSSCDIAYPGNFQCYAPQGTPAKVCETCDVHTLPFCDSGLRCHPTTKKCGRYCCDDGDCGPNGRCELDPMLAFGTTLSHPDDKVGICVNKDPMMPGPDCGAPAALAAPSGGACFAGFAGM